MSRPVIYKFRLYVAHDTQNSAQALANLNAICDKYLPGRHEIDVVNVFREPQRALAAEIRMTPTLLKLAPLPVQRIIGTLAQTNFVLQTLGLDSGTA